MFNIITFLRKIFFLLSKKRAEREMGQLLSKANKLVVLVVLPKCETEPQEIQLPTPTELTYVERVRDALGVYMLTKTLANGGQITFPGHDIVIGPVSPQEQEELKQQLQRGIPV